MSLASEASHIWHKLTGQRARAQAAAKRAFGATLARLGPQDIAIDLGANVGEFTRPMADTGAQVHAFEPDPHAVSLLRQAVAEMPNVTIHTAAVGAAPGSATLYRKKSFHSEMDRATKSSSLFGEKRNVTDADAVEVELVDFIAFLRDLDSEVALIKMDIEGAEVDVLEALLADPVAPRVAEIYVETHERALPTLADRTAALKTATQNLRAPRVNWDWH